MNLKKKLSWNKYKSKITMKFKNNNLDYVIDPTFENTNKLFFQLFKVGNNYFTRISFVKYYMSLVKIKVFNALIENKLSFEKLA